MGFADRIAKHQDKALHFLVGLGITVVVGFVTHPLAGQAACMLAAWFKEDYDRKRPDRHTKDGWDAFATALASVPGAALLGLLAALR